MAQYEKKPRKNKVITPTFVSDWQEGKFGPNFRVGIKYNDQKGNEQTLYLRCTKKELIQYFQNGEQTAIEYHVTDAGNYIIDGASPVDWTPSATPAGNGNGNGNGKSDFRSHGELIRGEALAAAATVMGGSGDVADHIIDMADVFVGYITDPAPEQKLETMGEKMQAAADVLGAVPERDVNDDVEDAELAEFDRDLAGASKLADEGSDENFPL